MRGKGVETTLCPVCHKEVAEQEAMADTLVVYYQGRFYRLMCPRCKGEFLRHPEWYAGGGRGEPPRVLEPCVGGGQAQGADVVGTRSNDPEGR